MKHRCPFCKKIIKASPEKQSEEAEFAPFCSLRCKLIDLGGWLDGKYKIVSKLADTPPSTSADEQ